MKKRLSLIMPLILLAISLAGSLLFYLQEDYIHRERIEHSVMADVRRQMGELQNALDHRLSAGDESGALRSLSLAATHPGIRTLLLVNPQHRVWMASHYIWKREAASTVSHFDDEESDQVIDAGVSQLAFNTREHELIQGYFPVVTEYRQGGPEKVMGTLYVEYDINRELRAAQRESRQQAAVFFLVNLLSAMLIGVLLHILVTRRVRLLDKLSGRFAAGDHGVRTGFTGNDELARLGQSFDAMAQQLTENIERQEKHRNFLAEAQKIGHFGSWALDVATGELEWSDQVFGLFEIDPKEIAVSYALFLNLVHPDDREMVDQAYKKSIQLRQPYQLRHRLLMSDGRVKWVEERCTHYFDEAGNILRSIGTVQDVTTQEEIALQLRIAAVAFETQQAIMVTDASVNIIRVNHAFELATGYLEAEVRGKNPRLLSAGRHDAAFYKTMWDAINTVGKWAGEIWEKRKDGKIYPKWLTITAIASHGVVSHYVGVFVDITEQKQAEEEIHSLAFFDPLTKLPNRRLLFDRVHSALVQSTRSRHYGALMFLDMDHFKVLNDTKGHEYGDKMLIEVASRLKSCVRDVDSIARFGGDEFVVLLVNLSVVKEVAVAQAGAIAEKIRVSLSQTYLINRHHHESSPSVGVVLFCGEDQQIDELFKRADMAMYQAKESGRNTVRFFEPVMQALLESNALLEHALRQAIANAEFELHFQVQTNQHNELLGAEVLLRWCSAVLGMVSPSQFIPIAEKTRLILPIGKWVLESACARLKAWESHPVLSNLHLAVNISPVQFHQEGFVEQVKAILEKTGANPKRLELELTENLVLEDVEVAIAKMTELKDIGVRFSMDDFGTGYSSLQYIKRLPIAQLKIDQSFVRDILTDPGDVMMVQTIVGIAQNFGYDVIAEGVEEHAQMLPLIKRGCCNFQGYLFSRPVALTEFEALVDGWGLRDK